MKNRENLSFTWYDEEGKLKGYLLAYQGKMENGTPGIYISDFAIEEGTRGVSGIKMISHWIKVVKEHYPDMPIFTRARASTSYRMLKVLAEKNNYNIIEDEKIQDHGEDFHRVTLEPK